jgi:phage FluMu protein Com
VEPALSVVVTVRCLGCGKAYAKPSAGGTVKTNPGCPKCGYVGWVADDERDLTEAEAPSRFGEDPHPRRLFRLH